MRMVASNRSDCSNSRMMMRSDGLSLSAAVLRSEGEREKKAISDADTKPEHASNSAVSAKAMIAPMEGAVTLRREVVSKGFSVGVLLQVIGCGICRNGRRRAGVGNLGTWHHLERIGIDLGNRVMYSVLVIV